MDKIDLLQEREKKYDAHAYDHEKRFVTSLTLVSGASLAFILTFSQALDDPERFLNSLVFSMWCFFVGIATSGSLSFILSIRYSRLGLSLSMARASLLRTLAEETNDFSNVNKYIPAQVLSNLSAKDYAVARNLNRLYFTLLSISAMAILAGLAWPLITLTRHGYFT